MSSKKRRIARKIKQIVRMDATADRIVRRSLSQHDAYWYGAATALFFALARKGHERRVRVAIAEDRIVRGSAIVI